MFSEYDYGKAAEYYEISKHAVNVLKELELDKGEFADNYQFIIWKQNQAKKLIPYEGFNKLQDKANIFADYRGSLSNLIDRDISSAKQYESKLKSLANSINYSGNGAMTKQFANTLIEACYKEIDLIDSYEFYLSSGITSYFISDVDEEQMLCNKLSDYADDYYEIIDEEPTVGTIIYGPSQDSWV